MQKTRVVGGGAPLPQHVPDRSELQIVSVPVGELREWELNPRRNDRAAEKLAEVFKAHGIINPIIATRDGTVRAGHTRLKAAKLLGLAEVPVVYVEFGSEAAARGYSLVDNRAGGWAEWDMTRLKDVFEQEEMEAVDIAEVEALTGFSQEEIAGIKVGWQPREPQGPAAPNEADGTNGADTQPAARVVEVDCPHCGGQIDVEVPGE